MRRSSLEPSDRNQNFPEYNWSRQNSQPSAMDSDNLTLSFFVFAGTLAGTATVIFVACYLCQRSLQRTHRTNSDNDSPSPASTMPAQRGLFHPVTPPPSYKSVVKAETRAEVQSTKLQVTTCEPPDYQEALRLQSQGYI